MIIDTTTEQVSVTLASLRAPAPWSAFVIPVSGFPLPEPERSRLLGLLRRISQSAAKRWNLVSEIFLELEQMKGLDCRYRFADHGRDWMPQVGLGVWPDRDPPALFTKEEFENWAPGSRMREVLCEVFRISTAPQHRDQARDAMMEYGCVFEILTDEPAPMLLGKMKPVYLDFIKSPSHRCFPFYVPLLEGKTLENLSSEQLDHWCSGISVYVRESVQDKGILIASTMPMAEILNELNGKIRDTPEGKSWSVPL